MVVGDIEGPLKCLAGVHHQLLAPQWHIRGEVRSQLDCGLEVLHVSPTWVERQVYDQIGVVGSQWVWVWSCQHSHRECVQHWVVYSWRQFTWWEGMHVLNLHKMGAARASQILPTIAEVG